MHYLNLEQFIEDKIRSAFNQIKVTPLNLGGISWSGGGIGQPPGGYLGVLPQTKVAFDFTEDETMDIPASGASLLDNLNRIRYRLKQLEISGGGGGGAATFLELTDTPNSYSGKGFYVVRVKGDESGLEFAPPSSGGGGSSTFLELLDTPSTYVGYSGYIVKVKNDETGLEFSQLGSVLHSYVFNVDGSLAQANGLGHAVVEGTITIKKVILYVSNKGSSGSTQIDIKKNGTSIFGSTKPTVAYNDSDNKDAVSVTVSASEGDVLRLDILSAASGAETLSVSVIYEAGSGVVVASSVSTFLQLTDTPSSYSGHGDKYLKVKSTEDGIEFSTISGGGGGSTPVFIVDAPPETAHSLDDEFNDDSFSGWTVYNHTGNSSDLTIEENSYGLTLKLDTTQTDKVLGIYKSLSGVTYPITFFTKVGIFGLRDKNIKAGFVIFQNPTSPTGDLLFVQLNSVGYEAYQAIELFTSYDDTTYDVWVNDNIGRLTTGVYLKLTIYQSGGSYYTIAGISTDGVGFIDFSSSNALPFTPAAIGLAVRKSNLETGMGANFRFFRAKNEGWLSARLDGRTVYV